MTVIYVSDYMLSKKTSRVGKYWNAVQISARPSDDSCSCTHLSYYEYTHAKHRAPPALSKKSSRVGGNQWKRLQCSSPTNENVCSFRVGIRGSSAQHRVVGPLKFIFAFRIAPVIRFVWGLHTRSWTFARMRHDRDVWTYSDLCPRTCWQGCYKY